MYNRIHFTFSIKCTCSFSFVHVLHVNHVCTFTHVIELSHMNEISTCTHKSWLCIHCNFVGMLASNLCVFISHTRCNISSSSIHSICYCFFRYRDMRILYEMVKPDANHVCTCATINYIVYSQKHFPFLSSCIAVIVQAYIENYIQ